MYRALYRKWRPRDFDDVCGQEQITDILKYEVAEGRTSHAYLFCGSRGTGKTTCAKILAKAVNCHAPRNGNPCNCCEACRSIDAGTATDVIEMDAASNTGVDNVRDIKDEIVFTPAELKYRVYIIDEVHMMSGSAFNALLKTLEEPPAHVLFILATTELHKLPSTIVSRCQRFDFRRLTTATIVSRLMKIAEGEHIDLREDGARLLARMAQGGMRDAISLLELCAGMRREIDEALVAQVLGAGNRTTIERTIRAIRDRDYDTLYQTVAEEMMSSRDLSVFVRDLLEYYRDMLVVQTTSTPGKYLDLTDAEAVSLKEMTAGFSGSMLTYQIRLLEDVYMAMQRADAPKRVLVELALTRICDPKLSEDPASLLPRMEALERELSQLKYGGAVATAATKDGAVQGADPIVAPENRAGKPENTGDVKEEKKIPVRMQKPRQEQPVYRAVSGWREIVDRAAGSRPSLRGFLDGSRGYRADDGRVYLVRVSSSFCARMLMRPETLQVMRVSIAESMGHDISDAELRIEAEDRPSEYTLLDEVEAALAEDKEKRSNGE